MKVGYFIDIRIDDFIIIYVGKSNKILGHDSTKWHFKKKVDKFFFDKYFSIRKCRFLVRKDVLFTQEMKKIF